MRAILAGIFVFGCLLGAVALLGATSIFELLPPWLVGLGLALFLILLCIAAVMLFQPRGLDRLGRKTLEQQIQELQAEGLLSAQDYQATRAFEIEEFEDEGCHYFLELTDGRVLFLSGQYLYDYVGDSEVGVSRRFPCSEFTVRRHRTEGYAVDIQCGGQVLKLDATAPAFGEAVWREGTVPEDGAITSARRYEDIKRETMRDAG